mgnify:CR=1 FL=1
MDVLDNLANNSRRASAFFIDFGPIVLLVGAVSYFFFGFDEVWHNYIANRGSVEDRKAFLTERNHIRRIAFIIWVLYSSFAEASSKQGTLGKIATGIKVVDQDGLRLSLVDSFKRNAFKLISFLIVALGFLWILWDKNRQGWHDKVAKTFVVGANYKSEVIEG